MWEFEQHLQKDEKVEYEGTPEWAGYFVVFGIIIALSWTIVIPLILIPLLVLNKLSTKYIITNKRVIMRGGIISDNFKSVTFKHITSISMKQGLFSKYFNIGYIVVDTAGSGVGVDLIWKSVKNPIQVKNQIEKHID